MRGNANCPLEDTREMCLVIEARRERNFGRRHTFSEQFAGVADADVQLEAVRRHTCLSTKLTHER